MWAAGIQNFNLQKWMAEPRAGKKDITLPKGSVIFSEGDENDSIFFILQGTVKLTISSPQGKEAIVGVLDGGDFLGETCVVGGYPRRTCRAVALSEVTLVELDRAAMIQLLQTNQDVLYTFLTRLLFTQTALQDNLSSSFLYSARKRLARLLVSLSRLAADPRSRRSFPKLGQEQLARMIGVTRQHVNANLMKFKASGHVQYSRGLKNFRVNKSMAAVAGVKPL
ncbi:MAG TPA: Crp/Fnr family transcriptional regulator [Candidatus Angelobacter sp.]|nr:Crp/Fnr family transcriptional regulator [Candidatus Angelobacter sp.]